MSTPASENGHDKGHRRDRKGQEDVRKNRKKEEERKEGGKKKKEAKKKERRPSG